MNVLTASEAQASDLLDALHAPLGQIRALAHATIALLESDPATRVPQAAYALLGLIEDLAGEAGHKAEDAETALLSPLLRAA